MSIHVVPNQPLGSLRDEAIQRFQSGVDMIVRINSLADIMQQRREEEFFVVRHGVFRKNVTLQQVVQHVPFRMILTTLSHPGEWHKQ